MSKKLVTREELIAKYVADAELDIRAEAERRVGQCPRCENAFYILRKGAQFCSRTCQNTHAVKKLRAKRKL